MISVVVVSWNVRDELRLCLESILRAHKNSALGYEIIVVDNASSDKSPQMVASLFPNVKLLRNDTNVGFAAACNQGVAVAKGEYLLFLNPDTVLSDEGVDSLCNFLQEQPNVGVVAPKLIYEDGEIQPSVRRYPTPWIMFLLLTKLSRLAVSSVKWRRYVYDNFNYQSLRSVEQVMGAVMVMPRSVFDAVGGFDSGFFIWFEEVDLCKRVRDAGYLVFFNPVASVVHARSRSFAQQSIVWRQKQFSRSARWYASKHFGGIGYMTVWLASWFAVLLTSVLAPIATYLKKYQATER